MRLLIAVLLLLSLSGQIAAGALQYHDQALYHRGTTWILQLPEGLELELLTDGLEAPRLMTFLPNGDLLAGSRSGKVYRLPPPYDRPGILVELPDYPHSLAWRKGELLIAQTDGLYRVDYRPGQTTLDRDDVSLFMPLPGGGGHNSRTVAIGPDGRVYLALGISGNCPDEYLDASYPFSDRRGGVLVLDESGRQPRWQTFASGLRNPVGFDWQPGTGVLYATNNGPDHLGYEQPPEYFARLDPGSFHGMPWYQFDGRQLRRDDCIRRSPPRPASQVSLPAATFPARNAPMGMAFVPENSLGPEFAGNAIVALKGSWGTQPRGDMFGSKATRRPPALLMVRFRDGEADQVEDLVTGFQRADGERLARPTGVSFGPDGALYFTSDSHLQGLFRLRRATPGAPP